jgi:hypothetical protein
VVGRRNHFGSKSARGTEVVAILYSLVESAKATGNCGSRRPRADVVSRRAATAREELLRSDLPASRSSLTAGPAAKRKDFRYSRLNSQPEPPPAASLRNLTDPSLRYDGAYVARNKRDPTRLSDRLQAF